MMKFGPCPYRYQSYRRAESLIVTGRTSWTRPFCRRRVVVCIGFKKYTRLYLSILCQDHAHSYGGIGMKTLAERPVCSGTPRPVNQVLLRCAGSRFPKGACSLDGDSRLAYTSQGIAHSTSAGPIGAALHGALQSPGKPLDSVMRAFFEPRLMHDFSQVRVHDEARSADSARALDARAYTVGRNIVFGASQYAPHTRDGRKLIAHELVHVIQQKEATGFAAQSVGSLQLSDPGDDCEHEAETISAKVMKVNRSAP